MKGTRGYVAGLQASDGGAPEEMICADIGRVIDELGENGTRVLRSFTEFKLMAGRTPEIAALFRPDQEGTLRLLEGSVEAGQRDGTYRREVEPRQAALGIYEAIFGAYYVAFANAPGDDPVAAAQGAVRRCFALLRAPDPGATS